jgi:hypothetical protein
MQQNEKKRISSWCGKAQRHPAGAGTSTHDESVGHTVVGIFQPARYCATQHQ